MPAAFQHVFLPSTSGRTLLLLHGTGGDERSLLELGRALDPQAALLSPRGQVLEHGHPRFFRRLAEGVFDEEDLIRRTHELADFIGESARTYAFDAARLYAVGYSNGANIAGALLLLRPKVLAGAALLRPMVPLTPPTLPNLSGHPVLVAAGEHDPIVPPGAAQRLETLLTRAGAEVTLSLESADHNLTEQTIATTRLWLAGQPR